MAVVSDYTALLFPEDEGRRWNYEFSTGTAAVVTYSLAGPNNLPDENATSVDYDTIFALTEAQKNAVRRGFDELSDVSGLIFHEVEDQGMIHMAAVTGSRFGAWITHPEFWSGPLEVYGFFDLDDYDPTTPEGYEVVLHELGHAVGLEHPFEGDNILREDLDTTNNTLMSYTEVGSAKDEYQRLDLDALDHLYGRSAADRGWSTGLHSGDGLVDAFRLVGSRFSETLPALNFFASSFVDGGGGNDRITGSYAADVLRGGTGQDTISSNGGADTISGGDGNDLLYGAERADQLSGDAGRDTLDGGAGDDTLSGGAAIDSLVGAAGDDMLFGDNGNDLMYGGDGDDSVFGGEDWDRMWLGAGNDEARGETGFDSIHGDAGDDVLFGNKGLDTLDGGDGRDALWGGLGSDLLIGGAGDDTLSGEDGSDTLQGNAGDDSLSGGAGEDELLGGQGRDTVEGGDNRDRLFGGRDDDELRGGTAGDLLDGGEGADVLYGNRGPDILNGGDGDDVLFGGDGPDLLADALGNNAFFGGAGDDSLIAASSETGTNTLDGGSGNDLMIGRVGSPDVFVFQSDSAGFKDRIRNFEIGTDALEIAASQTAGATFVQAGPATRVEVPGADGLTLVFEQTDKDALEAAWSGLLG